MASLLRGVGGSTSQKAGDREVRSHALRVTDLGWCDGVGGWAGRGSWAVEGRLLAKG